MPELPEVETVRRGIAPHLDGRQIARLELRRPDLRWPMPPELVQIATGATVTGLRRRSKYILIDLNRDAAILMHLGMSGRILIDASDANPTQPGQFYRDPAVLPRHDHVVITTDEGTKLIFNDARRFGMVDLIPRESEETHPLLARIGPEPFGAEFDGAYLKRVFQNRKAPVKQALLDQRNVAGLGNIYVSEALHRAGIHPARAAGRIGLERLQLLAGHIKDVLNDAIAAGGSSLRDHRQSSGELGYFQHSFRVYDQADRPCKGEGCDGTIRRIVQSGRSSYFCPACQR